MKSRNDGTVRRALNWIHHNRRSRRGISTIVANLIMLVIVVSLSSILFVWSMTSFGAYTGGAGYWFSSRSLANMERPSIESVFFAKTGSTNNLVTVYVRNVGTTPFTVGSVYVNATLYNIALGAVNVNGVQSIPITLSGQTWGKGSVQTITLATLRGTTIQTTWVA